MNRINKLIFAIAGGLVVLFLLLWSAKRISTLEKERDRYRNNVEVLSGDVGRYRVLDSLSGARCEALELTVKEFEKYRAEDAALIKALRVKVRDLSAVNTAQMETIIRLSDVPRDTIVIRDSVEVQAVAVSCGDEWYDFEGILTPVEFSGTLRNRDSLIVAETIKHRRFLGFLWKTGRVKSRKLDIVSRNPHTEILGVEHITISK